MTTVERAAPAKVNLTLHVTGQRGDGYHLLDSLVMFADAGDRITARAASETSLTVTGPMAAGVPVDAGNLVMRAAHLMGGQAALTLDKHLPAAAGLGGGSSDAAATLKALAALSGRALPDQVPSLGADVPVCLVGRAARMRGMGDAVLPLPGIPAVDAVLVNPRRPVATGGVFARLARRDNAPMPDALPRIGSATELARFVSAMRNDLEPAAIALEPVIAQVLEAITQTPECLLARMSGSGATCFGLYASAAAAAEAAGQLRAQTPRWWIAATRLS